MDKHIEKVQSVQKVQKQKENSTSHILTQYKDDSGSGESQADADECCSAEESIQQLQIKFHKMQTAYIDVTHTVEQQKHIIKTLTAKYEQLKTSKSYPLTEKTGRQILALFENDSREVPAELRANSTFDKKPDSRNLLSEPKIGTIKGEETYIGKGEWISTVSYENLQREKEPSKLITGLSRSIWGIKALSERCVRKQINTQSTELTPKKKAAVANFFEIWMRNKRKYPEDLIMDEIKKLNKYLNGAITSARSTIAPKKRKIYLKNDPTLSVCSADSEDKLEIDNKEDKSRKKRKRNTETPIGEREKNVIIAINEEKESVSKKGLLLDKDKQNDENISNLEADPLMITDNESINSSKEELSEIESIISIEKDEDLFSGNDDFIAATHGDE